MAIVTKTFTFTGPPQAIPDNNTTGISNAVAVSGIPAGVTVTGVTVNLNINHTFNGDLDISVSDPDGNNRILSTDNGGGGNNYTNVTFDSTAANPISEVPSPSEPITGTFDPEGGLAGLIPGAINGNWTLKVVDDAGGDTGSLTSWTLTITYDDTIIGTAAGETLTGTASGETIRDSPETTPYLARMETMS